MPSSHLIAFDIDNCLMPVDQPAAEPVRRALLALAAEAHIVFASGKPCLYLAGLTRGLGLMQTSLIGENGADIWVGCTMPPRRLGEPPTPEETAALISLRERVVAHFGPTIFFQPNAVGVTAFPPADGPKPPDIAAMIGGDFPDCIEQYVHVDSVDWAIKRFNKGSALKRLSTHLGIAKQDRAMVGDSKNDLPMADAVGLALWVGDPSQVAGTSCIPLRGIIEALGMLREWVER